MDKEVHQTIKSGRKQILDKGQPPPPSLQKKKPISIQNIYTMEGPIAHAHRDAKKTPCLKASEYPRIPLSPNIPKKSKHLTLP